MKLNVRNILGTAAAMSLALVAANPASAGMALTTAGTNAGFSLSTFIDGFPTTGPICCGPLGIAFPSSGGVLVSDYPGNLRLFSSDTDGQHASDVIPSQNYGFGNPAGLVSLGNYVYLAEQPAGLIVRLNNDGTFSRNVVSLYFATGISADPVTSLLYATTPFGDSAGIYSVDPNATTPVATLFAAGGFDGLTIDAASRIIYTAGFDGYIRGFSLTTGSQVFVSATSIPGGIDGVALGTGGLAGKLFVNTNAGTVYQYDRADDSLVLIASGGSRGDFVTTDPNGTVLLTQYDSMLRLTASEGSGFGDAPEPGTVALLLGGLAALAVGRRRVTCG